MDHQINGVTYSDELIDEMIDADSAGWTISEIALDLKLTRQQVIDVFLRFERYSPEEIKQM
jgi:hypothetical protein